MACLISDKRSGSAAAVNGDVLLGDEQPDCKCRKSTSGMTSYWAKTNPDGTPGVDVHQHLLRVGIVARILAEDRRQWFEGFGIDPVVVSALAGLHDLGKISAGFQSKCPAWLEKNGLTLESANGAWVNLQRDHSRISQFTLQGFLAEPGVDLGRSSANWWAAAVGCHHGRIHYPGERGLRSEAGMASDIWEERRREEVRHFLVEMSIDLQASLPKQSVSPEFPALWAVAGLTSVADWIGSDEGCFPTERDLAVEEIRARAAERIKTIGLKVPQVVSGLSFTDLFTFSPYELQTAAMEFIRSPGIYAIEAPMGMGKTEAALGVAYQLLCAGLATGIYFALPTQATSNRIHRRLNDFIGRICPDAPSARLIHANSWLMTDLSYPIPSATDLGEDDARQARDWFASAKRALLAPFGVGTVDQALLSILAAKHFFVRRFALAGKVVIVDEVHSYDIYTGTLVGKLCEELGKLGCTVLLLSATLTRRRRRALVPGFPQPGLSGEAEHYPLLSGARTGGQPLPPRATAGPGPKTVAVNFRSQEEALQLAVDTAKSGACVLWISNTVDRAQKVYSLLNTERFAEFKLGLLHARFPFFRREELEEYWMDALGKDGVRPRGCILVATQVVEQSVDLDADLMITELAPTDMLLQRMGRMWRHPREIRPVAAPELCVVREQHTLDEFRAMDAAAIKNTLGPKAWVYAPYVLLRSLEVWSHLNSIRLPGDIRHVLEETYADVEELPSGWEELRQQIEGARFAERMVAERNANLFNLALSDEEGVQTRLNSVPTVSLILAKERCGNSIKLLNGDRIHMKGDEFDITNARALHRNLVRVPKRKVFAAFQTARETANYVRGEQALAVIDVSGLVSVPGLRPDVRLQWDRDYGLKIVRDGGEADDEPGD